MPERSLWYGLHDAVLDRVETDMDTLTVTLSFHIQHINLYAGLSPRLRFNLILSGVRQLDLTRTGRYPVAGAETTSGKAPYRVLTRSLDWTTVAPSLPRKRFEVLQPTLDQKDGSVTLKLSGIARSKHGTLMSINMMIEADGISAERSDGMRPFDLETLEALGAGYWDAWSKKNRKVEDTQGEE